MTDARTDPDDAEAQAALAEAVATDTDAAGSSDGGAGSGEAARYRRRLRETEQQRDALAARLEAAQRREAERLAARGLADGTDLWRGEDTDLAGLLDDDGAVSADKVADTVAAIVAVHPHWAPRTVTADPDQGRRSEQQTAPPSFAQFLRGAAGGADVESWPRSRARRAGDRPRDDGTPAGEAEA